MPSHRRISAGRRQRIRINALLQTAASDLSKKKVHHSPGFQGPTSGLASSISSPTRSTISAPVSSPTYPTSPSSVSSVHSESSAATARALHLPIHHSGSVANRTPPVLPIPPSPSLQMETPTPSIRMDTPTPSLRMDTPRPFRMDTPTLSLRIDTPTPTPSIEMDRDDDDALSYASMDTNASMDTIVPARDATVLAYHTQVDIGAIRESVHHLREAVRVLSAMVEAAAATGSRPLV